MSPKRKKRRCRCSSCRLLALIDALPKPIAQTRVVTDPETGVSTLERLPMRFVVQR